PPKRRDDALLDAAQLHVELDREPEPRDEGEPVVERRRVGRQLRPVREHERAVIIPQHVELDRVEPVLPSDLDRCERVLARERGRAAVADAHDAALPAVKIHHCRRMTTTARSSASSPPAYSRQSSATASASARGASSRRSESSLSSRSTPYSSPLR